VASLIEYPTREQIENRAYELYLERGAADGYDVEDWLAAESELCQARNSETTPREKAFAATSGGGSAV